MRLGVHIRLAKGVAGVIDKAEALGCEALQMFSSNPNAWKVGTLEPSAVEVFRSGVERLGIDPVVLHTPYLLNLASSSDDIWTNSWRNLASALAKAHTLGAQYIVTHIGSHGGAGFDAGADKVAEAVTLAIESAPGTATVLLEAGSGAGNTVGSTFEELAAILSRLESQKDRIGVCLDTAHLWGAGYDISSQAGVDAVLARFDKLIGLSRLRVFHLNDTEKDLGSHKDRHWHIGQGNVGLEGFRAIVNHPALTKTAGIIETPDMDSGKDIVNLNVLKCLRTVIG